MSTIDTPFGTDVAIDVMLSTDVAVFDSETTGVDVEEARYVQVYAGAIIGGLAHTGRMWLVNPGVPIPPAASDVHGITDDDLEDADPPHRALRGIIEHLEDLADAAVPLVAFNAAFDLTILHRETRRHLPAIWWPHLEEILAELIVLDPFIIDKAVDRYRPGSRKLADVAEHYGLDVDRDTLHGADADARLAGRLMLELWRHPSLIGKTASVIHARCIEHAADQAASFADYLHSRGRHDEANNVDGRWPWRPLPDHDHDYRHRGSR